MTDIKLLITSSQAESIINDLIDYGYNVEISEGCFLDNYFCEIGENNLELGRWKMRKYLLITEIFTNQWSSELKLLMTDDKGKCNNILRKFLKNGRI